MAAEVLHFYKFGLYARKSAGKTCILAALAMKRLAHPRGISCTWILDPSQARHSRTAEEKTQEAIDFDRGREWLSNAIKSLEQGDVPPPTMVSDLGRFLYYFTTPEKQNFYVELIDYSGELVDPELSRQALAQRLRDHLHTLDGLLVLAEAPDPDKPLSTVAQELFRLEQAFALLVEDHAAGKLNNAPIALLVNKWDRVGPIDHSRPEQEHTKLETFLNSTPEPPHRSLSHVLRNTTIEDNFRAFPVSAFGAVVERETSAGIIHVPKQVNPLLAFGLEDPLLWLANRRDETDLSRLEASARELSFWRARLLDPDPATLQRRFPALDVNGQRVRRVQRRASSIALQRFGAIIALILALPFLAFLVSDRYQYHTLERLQMLEKPSAEDIAPVTSWLAQYIRPFPYVNIRALSHIVVLPAGSAAETFEHWEGQRDELLARRFLNAIEGSSDQSRSAEDYLGQFPRGLHAGAAAITLERRKIADQLKDYRAAARSVLSDSEPIVGNASSSDTRNLLLKIDSLPEPPSFYPDYVKDLYEKEGIEDLTHALGRLKASLTENYRRIIAEERKEVIKRYLEAGDVIAATREYHSLDDNHFLEEFKSSYPEHIYRSVEKRWQYALNSNFYQEARKNVEIVLYDRDIMRILSNHGDIIQRLQELIAQANEREDRSLYERIVELAMGYDPPHTNHNLKAALEDYLSSNERKMRTEVMRFKEYTELMGGPINLNLIVLQVHHDELYSSKTSHQMIIMSNRQKVIDQTYKPGRKSWTSLNHRGQIHVAKLDKEIDFTADITCLKCTWRSLDTSAGRTSVRLNVKKLLGGLTLPLYSDEGKEYNTEIALQMIAPQRPELPLWNSK